MPRVRLERTSRSCPNRQGLVLVDAITGDRIGTPRCHRSCCVFCAPIDARILAETIAVEGRPQRYIVLTLAGDSWHAIRKRITRFASTMREDGSFEFVYSVERNPNGTGAHVNVLQHGAPLTQARVRAAATRQGMGGQVFLDDVRSPIDVARYVLKGAIEAAYLPEAQAALVLSQHLGWNGGRLAHWSRQFFPSSPSGTSRAHAAIARTAARLAPHKHRYRVVRADPDTSLD